MALGQQLLHLCLARFHFFGCQAAGRLVGRFVPGLHAHCFARVGQLWEPRGQFAIRRQHIRKLLQQGLYFRWGVGLGGGMCGGASGHRGMRGSVPQVVCDRSLSWSARWCDTLAVCPSGDCGMGSNWPRVMCDPRCVAGWQHGACHCGRGGGWC